MDQRLSKRGQVSQTPEGDHLLVNDKGVAYKVSESVIVVWNSFEDKTISEVVEEIAAYINRSPEELREPIEQIALQLKEAELLA